MAVEDDQPATMWDESIGHMAAGIRWAAGTWTYGSDDEYWRHLAAGAMEGLASDGNPPRPRSPRRPTRATEPGA